MSDDRRDREGPAPLSREEAEDMLDSLRHAAARRRRRRRANRWAGAGISTLALGAAVVYAVLPLSKLGGPPDRGPVTPASSPSPVAATPAGDDGRIAFVRAQNGRQHLFVMDADGSNVRQLTSGAGDDWGPAWAPDNGKLAFFRCTQPNYDCDVYVINADGSGATDLAPGSTNAAHPSFSPDGTKIAFTEEGANGIQLFTMNADGTDVTQLTHVSGGGVLHPVWAPDGSVIAFDTAIGSARGRIGLVNPDGSGLRWLVRDAQSDYDILRTGTWSPDGMSLVFTRFHIDGVATSDVFVLTLADGQVRQLTHDEASEYPSWSPDGSKVAFDTIVSGRHQVFTMNADGSGLAQLTTDAGDDSNAVWTR